MIFTLVAAAALIGLGQLVKVLVLQFLAPVLQADFIPGFLDWYYVENTGVSFSLFENSQIVLMIITSVVLLVGLYILLFKRPKDKLEYIAILMIFSGGTCNLLDRFINGFVVDYIRPLFINFAIFNYADCLITVGFIVLVIAVIRSEVKKKRFPKPEEKTDE